MLFTALETILRGGTVDMTTILMQVLAVMVVIFGVLPLHECAHGWIAYKLGDNTAKYSGRLTLNPLPHIDPMGALFILLFGFGWAKPVPVDPRNFKNPKRGMAITALAGPVSNLLAALVGGFLYVALGLFGGGMPYFLFMALDLFLSYYIIINVSLAVFNLLPLPPLDGSRILGAFLSDRALSKYYQYERYIMLGLMLLLFLGVLDAPLGFLQERLMQGVMYFAKLPFFWAF
jgi:Zn-dependent protease